MKPAILLRKGLKWLRIYISEYRMYEIANGKDGGRRSVL